jgi:hypothetical protein
MQPTIKLTKRLLGAAILSAALITPAIASAQSYANGGQSQQIAGTVASVNDTWNITVHDARGYADSVELHQGTIINPTGLTLEPGMNVTIDGYTDGPNFDATEIDTPYHYSGPAPVAVYYGSGAWYPGYAQGWGPSFTLSFNVGTRSWQQRPFASGGRFQQAVSQPRAAYAQQQRTFAAPPVQQRAFAAPQAQQQRQFAAPAQRASVPTRNAAPASRGQDHRRGQ